MLHVSLGSADRAFVRFINKTDRMVELIWLNFDGKYVRYRTLEKDHYVDVNTFKNHPWIAQDIITKDRLHIEKNYTYNPQTTREYLQQRYPNKRIPENYEARIRANITLPVFSLKYRCLMEVRNHFQNAEDVDKLELPKPLAEHLKQVIRHRDSQLEKEIEVYEENY